MVNIALLIALILWPQAVFGGVAELIEEAPTSVDAYTRKHKDDFCYRNKYEDSLVDIQRVIEIKNQLCQYDQNLKIISTLAHDMGNIAREYQVEEIKDYISENIEFDEGNPDTTGFVPTLKVLMKKFKITDFDTFRAFCFPIHMVSFFKCQPELKQTCIFCEPQECQFVFRQTIPDYKISAEDGSEPLDMLRFQIHTDSALQMLGDFLISADDTTKFLISTCQDHFITEREIKGYLFTRNITVSSDRLIFDNEIACGDQWAQDYSKPGMVKGKHVTLATRHFRGVEPSSYNPSGLLYERHRKDTEAPLGVKRKKFTSDAAYSPLYFEGGNVVIGGGRVFIGADDLIDNKALGLTHEQITKAFSVEFGGLPVTWIPQNNFHIDLDMAVVKPPKNKNPVILYADTAMRVDPFFQQAVNENERISTVEQAQKLYFSIVGRERDLKNYVAMRGGEERKLDIEQYYTPQELEIYRAKRERLKEAGLDLAEITKYANLVNKKGYLSVKEKLSTVPGVQVIAVPDNYTNIVVSENILYMPTYSDHPAQNQKAREIYESLGFEVKEMPAAQESMKVQGGPRCNVETYRRLP